MFLDDVIETVESAEEIDPFVRKAESMVGTVLPEGPVREALQGKPLGHRLHPALVSLPIGLNVGVSLLDVLGGEESRRAATILQAAAILSAVPAAVTGWADYTSIDSRSIKRVGLVHALEAGSAMANYGISLVARATGHHRTGAVFAGLGAIGLASAGYIGGHLAYVNGVGVKAAPAGGVPTREVDTERA